MKSIYIWLPFLWVALFLASCKDDSKPEKTMTVPVSPKYSESYRPQFHFTPEKMWMNDPNGMVYHKDIYHLFYQYYPDSTVWGPMHWGHAVSKDLLNWEHKPIALYPDTHGYIFSGSAVLDASNTSGFGTTENPPLVAIFTYHDAERKKAGKTSYETQGIAYSLDNGDSWTVFEGNPVVDVPDSTDFRDPKVFWHQESSKWIMTLVAGDHAEFYGSPNLKDWELLGEFGKDTGAHGGVWECPDLLRFEVAETGEEKWVLFISINPGAPNGGSGTQYFVGDFDGKTFTTDQTEHLWIDWGTDNYAGVTYSNAPDDEKIFLGWMSNWQYANETPTEDWRGAMTLPRKLDLMKVGDGFQLFNYPIEKIETLVSEVSSKSIGLEPEATERIPVNDLMQSEIRFTTASKDFRMVFGNDAQENLVFEMNGADEVVTLDRSRSGLTDFQEDFGEGVQSMPVPDLPEGSYEVRIFMDASSIEVFIGEGQYAMTALVFPKKPYNLLQITNTSDAELLIGDLTISEVKSVW